MCGSAGHFFFSGPIIIVSHCDFFSESEDEEDRTDGLYFRPVMDMARFQKLLQQAETEETQQRSLESRKLERGGRKPGKTSFKVGGAAILAHRTCEFIY